LALADLANFRLSQNTLSNRSLIRYPAALFVARL
jgi:hypothetical protein